MVSKRMRESGSSWVRVARFAVRLPLCGLVAGGVRIVRLRRTLFELPCRTRSRAKATALALKKGITHRRLTHAAQPNRRTPRKRCSGGRSKRARTHAPTPTSPLDKSHVGKMNWSFAMCKNAARGFWCTAWATPVKSGVARSSRTSARKVPHATQRVRQTSRSGRRTLHRAGLGRRPA